MGYMSMSTKENQTKSEGPPVLLSSIELENFKSVTKQAVVLRPLSVFVGPNSAGKTTIIQSILMQVRPPEDPRSGLISLNDEVTNLGSIQQLRREGAADGDTVAVGGELSLRVDDAAVPWVFEPGLEELRKLARFETGHGGDNEGQSNLEVGRISWTQHLVSPSPETSPGSAVVDSTDMSVVFDVASSAEGKEQKEIRSPTSWISTRFDRLDDAPRQAEGFRVLRYRRRMPDIAFRREALEPNGSVGHPALMSSRSAGVAYADQRRGYPDRIWCFSDVAELVVGNLLRCWSWKVRRLRREEGVLTGDQPVGPSEPTGQEIEVTHEQREEAEARVLSLLENHLVPQAVLWVNAYFDFLESQDTSDDGTVELDRHPGMWFADQSCYPVDDAGELETYLSRVLLMGLPDELFPDSKGEDDDAADYVVEALEPSNNLLAVFEDMEFAEEEQWFDKILGQVEPPSKFAAAIWDEPFIGESFEVLGATLNSYFGNHVFHVGPLRAEPRRSYAIATDLRHNYVGEKGEYTTNRLAHLSGTEVICPSLYGEHETVSLAEAVGRWMGQGEDKTGLRLFSGYEAESVLDLIDIFQVHQPGLEIPRHLTELGIGVSQVLPVVVQCLLAQPGELVLLQQPELHLHPALQQRLGDFLLACARSGRQIILESHSEYLISRLARRVAEDPIGQIGGDLFNVILTELGDDGTVYTQADIDRYGSITWPTDFFDEGASEAFATLRAGLDKQESDAVE